MTPDEEMNEKIKEVAHQIQEILVANHMAMIPTISLQPISVSPLYVPDTSVSDIIKPI